MESLPTLRPNPMFFWLIFNVLRYAVILQELGQCPLCSKHIPLDELVPHAANCNINDETPTIVPEVLDEANTRR